MKNKKAFVQSCSFGEIVIDGTAYDHDVIITISGKIRKRKKKLSKKYYGTSHVISLEEAQYLYEKDAEEIIIGTGMYDMVTLSPEASEFLADQRCQVTTAATPQAIELYNSSPTRVMALFHITC